MEPVVKKGIFTSVSVGPGNPEWLTLEAVRVLKTADVIAAPVTAGGREIAYEIAAAAVDLSGKQKLPLQFSMTSDPEVREKEYSCAEEEIVSFLEKGRNVAMTVLGDVSIYSTASYLDGLVRQKGFETKTVPGVPSFCAAASRAGIDLVEGRSQLHILPGAEISDGEFSLPGTKVFMKSGRGLRDLLEKIREEGLDENSVLIQDCGLPGEKIRTGLSNDGAAPDPMYFSLVIVKE